jgi:hypothetical protein
MADRVSLTDALADANIDHRKAERIATDPRVRHRMTVACLTRGVDAIHDNVATKQDLQHVETALRAEVSALEQRMLPQQRAGRVRAIRPKRCRRLSHAQPPGAPRGTRRRKR